MTEPVTKPVKVEVPCAICKSEYHTTGQHNSGTPEPIVDDPNGQHNSGTPAALVDGGMSTNGQHNSGSPAPS